MKTIIVLMLSAASFIYGQTFKIENLKGNVKAQIGTSELWVPLKRGQTLDSDVIVATGKNSFVKIEKNNETLTLKNFSAIKLASIKKMSVNDLILALAMEDMLNAPKKKENLNSKNTAVYGAEINGIQTPMVESDDFGIKRLNGAVQLAESGFEESAVVFAKETFRKYPETNSIASFRIYFANVLFNLGLNEDAYDDFKSITSLTLNDKEKQEVETKLNILAKKLMK